MLQIDKKWKVRLVMPEPILIVYKGPTSQTGLATIKEFPEIFPQWKEPKYWKNKSFNQIKSKLLKEQVLAVLPMWNSHKGEIRLSHVLEIIFQKLVKLYALWPDLIVFECIVKENIKPRDIKKIISVHVAEDQCSLYIEKLDAEFIPADSTPDAVEKFRKNPEIQAVLCAPGQNYGYTVLCTNAQNPINFTSFALLGCLDSYAWTDQDWGSLLEKTKNISRVYFGAQMPIRSVAFSDDQKALFSELADGAETINDIPKILFVTKRTPDQCGLLIEATNVMLPDEILTEEGDSTEIAIIQDIGKSHSAYSEKIYELLTNNFSSKIKHDFIRHIGKQTCFFACPSLQILMHGFEDRIVEPVMRLVIDKYFKLYASGIGCSDAQRKFFKKHKDAYYESGMDFINFTDIGLNTS